MSLILLFLDVAVLFWVAARIRANQPASIKPFFWPALAAKLLAGAAVGAVYFFYYGDGDTISFWHDGLEISNLIGTDPWGAAGYYWNQSTRPELALSLSQQAPRSLFFVKITGLLALVTGGNYWIMASILSFIGFLAAWYLFKRLIGLFPASRFRIAAAFLFYPSVVFWSSGLIKESLGLAALFFLAGVCMSAMEGRGLSIPEYLLIILSLWVGWNLKYYWLGIFLPVAVTTLLVAMLRHNRPWMEKYELGVWTILFAVLLIGATSIHPNFYPSRFLNVICQSNQEFMQLTAPDEAVRYYDLQPTLPAVLLNAPQALIAGLFRPFVWESTNVFSVVAGIENLVLLIAVFLALPSLPKVLRSRNRMLVAACITYIIMLATFLALSAPNFGTLSRYKIAVLPFLLFLSLEGNRWITRRS